MTFFLIWFDSFLHSKLQKDLKRMAKINNTYDSIRRDVEAKEKDKNFVE
jgi:hypothetical protein